VQDPERYLKALSLDPPCAVDPSKPSAIDSSTRVNLNYEIYYFSSRAAMQRFRKNPLLYCGPLTDPVTMKRFQPSPRSPKAEYLGRTYYFSADSTKVRFLERPDRFADRKTGKT
jgi:YHS domain-containing protein